MGSKTTEKEIRFLTFVFLPEIRRYVVQEVFTFKGETYYPGHYLTPEMFDLIKLEINK